MGNRMTGTMAFCATIGLIIAVSGFAFSSTPSVIFGWLMLWMVNESYKDKS